MNDTTIKGALSALRGELEINVVSNNMGHLHLTPVDPEVARLVSITNQYNGSSDVYLQLDDSIAYVLDKLGLTEDDLPTTVKLDSWDYRHLVGGQSD